MSTAVSYMSYRQHAVRCLILGLPLIGGHLAQIGIGLTDTIMLGRYGVEELAAQVLGGTLFFVMFLMGAGFAWAVMPLVATADGRGDETEARRVTRMALWLSFAFGVLAMPVFLFARPLLMSIGQEAGLATLAGQYLTLQGWSIFPALGVMVIKSFLAGLERTQVVLWTTLAGVLANALANYVLIFGNWGAPELGIVGAAWASVLSTFATLIGLVIYAAIATPQHAVFRRLWVIDRDALGRVFRLGWPIGMTSLAEVSLFAAASVMMGWLGVVALAAHGIALQVISVLFMIHVGLANVATIRAGNALGRADGPGLRRGARTVQGLSALVVLATIVLLLGVPGPLMALFLDPGDPVRGDVIALGIVLLAAAAVFQLVDAAQVMALGLLRGVQDTRVPMVIAGLSYWGIGAPLAYVMGFVWGFGGVGVWLGMAAGLTLAGVLMNLRFWRGSAYAVENGSFA